MIKKQSSSVKSKEKHMTKSVLGLKKVYYGKTATTLKCNALVASLVHVIWLKLSASRRRFSIDYGYTMAGFSLVGSGEMATDSKDGVVEKNVSL